MNKPLEEYIILTSKTNMSIFTTKEYSECYDFIRKNPDVKFNTINYNAKPSYISKPDFLENYFKVTNDEPRLFELVDVLLPKYSNASYFISKLNGGKKLLERYKNFKQVTDKHL